MTGSSECGNLHDDGTSAHVLDWVYILTNHARTLYVGVTNDLERRVREHRAGALPGFTKRYRVDQLVHYEAYSDVRDALRREKQIKGWTRAKKLALIEVTNAGWVDLAARLDGEGERHAGLTLHLHPLDPPPMSS